MNQIKDTTTRASAKPQSTFCLGHLYTERILVSGEYNIGQPA